MRLAKVSLRTQTVLAPAEYFMTFTHSSKFSSNTHHGPVVYLQVVCGAALAGVQGKSVNGHLDDLLVGGVQDPAA